MMILIKKIINKFKKQVKNIIWCKQKKQKNKNNVNLKKSLFSSICLVIKIN